MKEMPGKDALNQVAAELRQRLAVPEDWVQVFGDEEDGYVVGLALDMQIEDVGTGETGPSVSAYPTRFAYIGQSGDVWFAKAYEQGDLDADEEYEATVEIRLGAIDTADVTPAVASLVHSHARFHLERS